MVFPLAVLSVLVVGALFEAAAALGWRSIGAVPGSGPVGEGFVLGAGLLAMAVGAAIASGFSLARRRSMVLWLLAPVAAGFMVARFYEFDPYYAPSLRRFSDGGGVSPTWVLVVAAIALVAGLVALVRPREGFALSVPAILLCAFTAFVFPLGH